MASREQMSAAIDALVDEQRSRCPWFLRADWYPRSFAERKRALAEIRKSGDHAAFRRAAELSSWLSRACSAESAA